MKPRDMSQREFDAALLRNGMKRGYFGYYDVGIPGHNLNVYAGNAGAKRRAQLAYLISERDMWAVKFRAEDAARAALAKARGE